MPAPETVWPSFGVHYHQKVERCGRLFTICPFCGKEYRSVRKDFESFRLSSAPLKHLNVHYKGRTA